MRTGPGAQSGTNKIRKQLSARVWKKKLNFQAVIKSAASAASPKTKIQESRGCCPPLSACRAVVRGLPCILVIGEAALAADLITGLIFKHLERNLAKQAAREANLIFERLQKPISANLAALAAKLLIPTSNKI